ncbi:hypothetical protein KEM55_007213, partial [Ascosphaera atra]
KLSEYIYRSKPVIYTMNGLDEKPDEWVQQFYDSDRDDARQNWCVFKAKLTEQFNDPDFVANTHRELVTLRQGKDLTDHVNNFENSVQEHDGQMRPGPARSYLVCSQDLPGRSGNQISI